MIYHLYNFNTHITIATEQIGNTIYYGVSYCSPNDVFNECIGEKLAESRLGALNYGGTINVSRDSDMDLFRCICDIMVKDNYPKFAYTTLLLNI